MRRFAHPSATHSYRLVDAVSDSVEVVVRASESLVLRNSTSRVNSRGGCSLCPGGTLGVRLSNVKVDESVVIAALREAGARFAFVHGSRAVDSGLSADSDLDVGAWWVKNPPTSWEVSLPGYADLVVLNTAPLWLAGRIAQYGRLLFDDDPPARVAWQADTRLWYADEIPAIRQRYAERTSQMAAWADGRPEGRDGRP